MAITPSRLHWFCPGTDHAAEAIGQARPQHEDQQQLHQVRQRRWIFEGMRGISVEEPAAVAAQKLDRLLRGDRPARDRLAAAFEGGCHGRGRSKSACCTPCVIRKNAATAQTGSST